MLQVQDLDFKPDYFNPNTGRPYGSTSRRYDAAYRSDRAEGMSHPQAFKRWRTRRLKQHRSRVKQGYLDPLPTNLGVSCDCVACMWAEKERR